MFSAASMMKIVTEVSSVFGGKRNLLNCIYNPCYR